MFNAGLSWFNSVNQSHFFLNPSVLQAISPLPGVLVTSSLQMSV